jgi:GATA-binding protein
MVTEPEAILPLIMMSRNPRPHDAAAKHTLAMSGAQYGERGGLAAAVRASSALEPPSTVEGSTGRHQGSNALPSPIHRMNNTAQSTSQTAASTTSKTTTKSQVSLAGSKLDLSLEDSVARSELLRESVFPGWKDDASGGDIGSPDEMQKKDPLATQIWKLYSKTKTQLPNQERMENLTWRMMAMSLRRREREQTRYVLLKYSHEWLWIMKWTLN